MRISDPVPPPGAPVVALALPLFVIAGAVSGVALALARSDEDLYYLVDNAAVDGAPIWVHEAEVERCQIARLNQRA